MLSAAALFIPSQALFISITFYLNNNACSYLKYTGILFHNCELFTVICFFLGEGGVVQGWLLQRWNSGKPRMYLISCHQATGHQTNALTPI